MDRNRKDFLCSLCNEIVSGNYKALTHHLQKKHYMKTSANEIADLVCGQGGCVHHCRTFHNFHYHLHSCDNYNSVVNLVENVQLPIEESNAAQLQVSADDNVLESTSQISENPSATQSPSRGHSSSSLPTQRLPINGDPITQSLASLYLKIRAENHTAHTTIDSINSHILSMIRNMSHDDLDRCKGNNKFLKQLGSQNGRTRYYSNNFGLIHPTELAVSSTLDTNFDSPESKQNTFMYIPIKKTLSALFSNENFRNLYFEEQASTDGFMRGHRDSDHFRNHPLFSDDNFALRIQLFFDDVGTGNPLGSKAGQHTMGMFNFMIVNLSPKHNSQLCHIFPVAVVNTIDLSVEGFDFVLRQIEKELMELESDDGMKLNVPNNADFSIRGTIVGLCCDTKGAHEISGFLSASANRFCRLCLVRRGQILKLKRLEQIESRTRENYDAAVEALSKLTGKSKEVAQKDTGVKCGCVLNSSRFFHIVDHNMLDAMHDFLEGICPFILKLVLRVWYEEFNIRADVLNKRIQRFKYSYYDQTNKPIPKFTDDLIRDSGNTVKNLNNFLGV